MSRRRTRADRVIDSLEPIHGLRPRPTRLPELMGCGTIPTRLDCCPGRIACIDAAVKLRWNGMDCSACEVREKLGAVLRAGARSAHVVAIASSSKADHLQHTRPKKNMTGRHRVDGPHARRQIAVQAQQQE